MVVTNILYKNVFFNTTKVKPKYKNTFAARWIYL